MYAYLSTGICVCACVCVVQFYNKSGVKSLQFAPTILLPVIKTKKFAFHCFVISFNVLFELMQQFYFFIISIHSYALNSKKKKDFIRLLYIIKNHSFMLFIRPLPLTTTFKSIYKYISSLQRKHLHLT